MTPERYLARADELDAVAERMSDAFVQAEWHGFAEAYRKIAEAIASPEASSPRGTVSV